LQQIGLKKCRCNTKGTHSTNIDLFDLFFEIHGLDGFLGFIKVARIVDELISG
jgi:hypothetical protein